jgi:hypothetical protein
MSAGGSAAETGAVKPFLRWCALVVVAVLVMLGAVYLAHGVTGQADVNAARRQAAAELTAALPASEAQARRDRDRARSLSGLGTPTYGWQELVCELNTTEGGWIVQDYVQECQVRSVDLFPASGPAAGDCAYQPLPLDSAGPDTGVILSAVRGPSTAFESDRPWAASCPDWVLTPSPPGSSRLLQGRRPTDLSSSPAWVALSTSTPVSSTSLGCSPWKIVFCNAPVDGALLDPDGD